MCGLSDDTCWAAFTQENNANFSSVVLSFLNCSPSLRVKFHKIQMFFFPQKYSSCPLASRKMMGQMACLKWPSLKKASLTMLTALLWWGNTANETSEPWMHHKVKTEKYGCRWDHVVTKLSLWHQLKGPRVQLIKAKWFDSIALNCQSNIILVNWRCRNGLLSNIQIIYLNFTHQNCIADMIDSQCA